MRTVLAASAALLLSTAAHAASNTTDLPVRDRAIDMLPGCKFIVSIMTGAPTPGEMAHNGFKAGHCLGIVQTLTEPMRSLKMACTPETATREQGVRVVIRYLERHPERLHEDFTVLAMLALEQAWPCK